MSDPPPHPTPQVDAADERRRRRVPSWPVAAKVAAAVAAAVALVASILAVGGGDDWRVVTRAGPEPRTSGAAEGTAPDGLSTPWHGSGVGDGSRSTGGADLGAGGSGGAGGAGIGLRTEGGNVAPSGPAAGTGAPAAGGAQLSAGPAGASGTGPTAGAGAGSGGAQPSGGASGGSAPPTGGAGGPPPGGATATTAVPPPSGGGATASEVPPGVLQMICGFVRAGGYAPLRRGEPGYAPELDPDGNGLACE